MKFRQVAIATGVLAMSVLGASQSAISDELDTILENKSMKIAMTGAYPPFNFIDDENKVVGFDPAIGKEIAKRMGIEVEVVTTAWDGIIAGLLANKYDAIVGSMSITDKRKEVVDFVGPYYRMNRAVFVKEGSTANSIDDLMEGKIGATLGETHEKWAREKGGWKVKTYKGLPELLLEVDAGRVDAIVGDDIPVLLAIKKQDSLALRQVEISGESVADAAGIAIRQGNPKLLAAMQEALDAMMEDGTYTKIAEKWIGADIR